jgi:hypothetical protein
MEVKFRTLLIGTVDGDIRPSSSSSHYIPVFITGEGGCDLEPIWMWWWREKSHHYRFPNPGRPTYSHALKWLRFSYSVYSYETKLMYQITFGVEFSCQITPKFVSSQADIKVWSFSVRSVYNFVHSIPEYGARLTESFKISIEYQLLKQTYKTVYNITYSLIIVWNLDCRPEGRILTERRGCKRRMEKISWWGESWLVRVIKYYEDDQIKEDEISGHLTRARGMQNAYILVRKPKRKMPRGRQWYRIWGGGVDWTGSGWSPEIGSCKQGNICTS